MIHDTDVLVDFLRDVPGCSAWLAAQRSSQRNTTVITHMELLEGCPNKERVKELRQILGEQFWRIYPIDQRVAETALHLMERYRPAYNLRMADALIAATSLVHQETLATWNQKDFRFISGLDLITPDYAH